jgi:hypothetical protein
MLFSDTASDKVRDHLIQLVEAAIFCMRLLETPGIPEWVAPEAAHKTLYEALGPIVDANIANSFEYGYMLDQACRKLQPFIAEDRLSR